MPRHRGPRRAAPTLALALLVAGLAVLEDLAGPAGIADAARAQATQTPAARPALATRVAAAAAAAATTAANPDPAYRALLAAEHRGLLLALRSAEAHPPGAAAGRDPQRRAFDYDFAVKANQEADIALIGGFTSLPRAVLDANMAAVTAINHDASAAQQDHAVFDAAGPAYLYFVAEALGPKLGAAFLAAYDAGEIPGAAALIKASEIGTGGAKKHFDVPRPFAVPGNAIRLVPDRVVAGDGAPTSATGGAYPSGHTMVGSTVTLLLAAMLPERFAALVARGEGYGYSRVVLGVHYPLDVIASRIIGLRNVARDLADPRYRPLFAQARDELRTALERRCGEPLARCAAPAGDLIADPWADAARQRAFNGYVLRYDLPPVAIGEGEGAGPPLPEGAEVLLEALRPDLTAAARRLLLERTALPAGAPLDEPAAPWQRIDLYEAALAAAEPAARAARQTRAD